MIDRGKRSIIGVGINVIDYDAALDRIMTAARHGKNFAVSALAVHGVMTGFLDPDHRHRLNALDMTVPDGQPVRWSLALLHGETLPARVYGPDLTLRLCAAAAEQDVPVYFYGSTEEVLVALKANLQTRFPALRVAGTSPSQFRRIDERENDNIMQRIRDSGAKLVFVGLGCPRQEVWAFENRGLLNMPLIAVGAAFDFHALRLKQAPEWMQRNGLEWVFRLIQEPRRLWRRYILLNPLFCMNVLLQLLKLRDFSNPNDPAPARRLNYS